MTVIDLGRTTVPKTETPHLTFPPRGLLASSGQANPTVRYRSVRMRARKMIGDVVRKFSFKAYLYLHTQPVNDRATRDDRKHCSSSSLWPYAHSPFQAPIPPAETVTVHVLAYETPQGNDGILHNLAVTGIVIKTVTAMTTVMTRMTGIPTEARSRTTPVDGAMTVDETNAWLHAD